MKFYLLVALGIFISSVLGGFGLMLKQDSPVFTDNFLERLVISSAFAFIVILIAFLGVVIASKNARPRRKSKDKQK